MNRAPIALACLFVALIALPTSAQADLLSEYRWQNRLLLVFAANPDDPERNQLQHALDRSACELTDRDMVIGWFHETGGNRLGTQ